MARRIPPAFKVGSSWSSDPLRNISAHRLMRGIVPARTAARIDLNVSSVSWEIYCQKNQPGHYLPMVVLLLEWRVVGVLQPVSSLSLYSGIFENFGIRMMLYSLGGRIFSRSENS